MDSIFQTLVYFGLTVVVGARIAHVWQSRSAKEARFFEASKDIYNQMIATIDSLSDLIGRRIYATQRVCLTSQASQRFDEAVFEYHNVIIEWNQKLLTMELSIRTRFRDSYLSSFECLQGDLRNITIKVDNLAKGDKNIKLKDVLGEIREIRFNYFNFVQGMVQEAKTLHRQMHFGVIIRYDNYDIKKMSTYDLIKSLFSSRIEGQDVVRSPSDFGLPVNTWDARFGIYE